ncbi:MAG: hypothetical protein RLZZ437_1314 [Pseudomonadota bacterium]
MRLLLDTNVLVLFIVGSIRPEEIGKAKRIQEFDRDDFDLIAHFASQTREHISTAHVLAETSNFIGSGYQEITKGACEALGEYVTKLSEIPFPAKEIVSTEEYRLLGLTDAAVLLLSEGNTRVISTDFHLCNRLTAKGVDAVNPRNFRTPGYAV